MPNFNILGASEKELTIMCLEKLEKIEKMLGSLMPVQSTVAQAMGAGALRVSQDPIPSDSSDSTPTISGGITRTPTKGKSVK